VKPIANPINSFELAYLVVQCVHVAGFTLSVGTTAIVDLRLLDLVLRRLTPSRLLRETGPWTLMGMVLAIVSGLLLFTSDRDMYYLNLSFDLKMILLVMAVIFNYTTHRKAVSSSTSPVLRKLIAGLSLTLWVSVLFCGVSTRFSPPLLGFKV
jgi:hypothetical protein